MDPANRERIGTLRGVAGYVERNARKYPISFASLAFGFGFVMGGVARGNIGPAIARVAGKTILKQMFS